MNRLIYQVAVGPSSRLYEFCTASVREYCYRHSIDHIVQTEPILRINPDPKTSGRSDGASRLGYLPIYEKENALAYLGEYDQVAVIDADVWIRPTAPNVFAAIPAEADFAAVVERDMPLTKQYRAKIRSYSQGQFRPLDDVNWRWNDDGAEFMNMGVMVMGANLKRFLNGQTPREFLARPEFKRFVDGIGHWKWSTDQTLLGWWLRHCGARVYHLDWRWNCLYSAVGSFAVQESHFIHFFLSDYLPHKGERIEELVSALQKERV